MSNLSPWKSNQTVTSLFLPRNGHITHTTINILSLCAHGIPWYPPSGPETDGNGNAVRNYPTNYHANPENGRILRKRKLRILIIMWPGLILSVYKPQFT